jgi:calmodulin
VTADSVVWGAYAVSLRLSLIMVCRHLHQNNGTVTVDELRSALVYQGLGEEAISTVFQNIDVDHSGRINYLEFLASTCETMGFLEEERLMEAFARLDEDANGYITSDELRALLGHEYSEADIEAMIREADTSGDGMIQYDEFARMMLGEKRRSSELQEVTQWVAKRGSTDSVPSRASSLKSSLRGRGQSASDNDRISLLEPSVAPGTATTDGG